MDATAWTVIGATITILIAIGSSFRSQRADTAKLHACIHAQGKEMRERIDTKVDDLRERIDVQGQDLRDRIDAQGQDLRAQLDAQGHELAQQLGQLRERMAHLEGLLEGLREAITGKRVA